MNIITTSQYMDKQIMDLSNSQSSITSKNGNDFIDFMNLPAEKKEDMVPSYDFMPIRPAAASSSPKAARSNFDSDNDDPPLKTWNSLDSKTNSSPVRNYNSVDVEDPAKFVLGKNHKASNAPLDRSLVSDIEKIMTKHMDPLMHAIDNLSSRLTQLETRTRHLEHSIDDLKMSVGNNHGAMDGKMRLLENILTEVQSGVKEVRDKQGVVEAQLQFAKLQIPKAEQVESKISAQPDSAHAGVPTHHQFSGVPQMTASPANAPPPPPQQNIQPQVQHPNQFPQSQIPPVPQRDPYFPPHNQTPENQNQQYQLPQIQPPLPQQYHPPPQPSQSHSSFPPMGHHHPEETLQMPPQNYQMGARPSPPSQQYYGPTPNVYDPPPTSTPGAGYSNLIGPPSGAAVEPYPYGSSPSQYGTGSPVKQQQLSSTSTGQSGGSGYPQLPTARILPQALPTASAVSGSGGGSGSGNRVPVDDVVDRVTNMGFPRDQVRATVRKLTENGQAVDLNMVLDKLMNDGDGRNWYGR